MKLNNQRILFKFISKIIIYIKDMGKIIEREANLKDALVELDIIIDIIENYRDTLEKINRKMKIEIKKSQ